MKTEKIHDKTPDIIVVYPWGNPLLESSGVEKRSSSLIRAFEKSGMRVTIIGPIPIQSGEYTINSQMFFSYKGHGGLVLDWNPSYYVKLVQLLRKYQGRSVNLVLTGPLGCLGALFVKIVFNGRKKILIVYDAHNVEKERVESGAFSTQSSLLRIFTKIILIFSEWIAVRTSDIVFSISHRDKRVFKRTYGIPPERILVIRPIVPTNRGVKYKRKCGILFHGSFKYFPNKEAVDFILEVSENLKWARFYLAGSGMPKKKLKNVEFMGFVENLDEFLSMGDLALVPLKRGAGVKLKILDYLLRGIPVITTKIGAQGLEFTHMKNAIVVNLDEIEEIVRFLSENPKYKRKIGVFGRKHAEVRFSGNIEKKRLSVYFRGDD
ncbi:glycosyltransferase [Thermococcus sp. 5-4]|uniref:glycosyltransferase n=1 Tax=Thermococcus sp. 5-4 TaxID=2008440 RepID=UPI000B49CF6D|nr:glycosyltransferase [Thermococcus sp. 5-4]ASA78490.1 hypothetical protein CDI07_09330 [Thermococcus sp. 5-4]